MHVSLYLLNNLHNLGTPELEYSLFSHSMKPRWTAMAKVLAKPPVLDGPFNCSS